MKSKKSHSKKFIFNLSVFKNLFVPSSLSSSRDIISDMDYAERVDQIANMLVGDQVNYCGNHQTQSPIITQTSKSLSRISSGDHKRTQQGVSARLLLYLYKLHMGHATNNYSCLNIHVSSISAPCIHYEVAMLLTCFLILFIQTTLVHSRPMISHHVISHVTTVICLFIVNKKKKKFKRKELYNQEKQIKGKEKYQSSYVS